MIEIAVIGIAGVLFMLGVISLQLGSMKKQSGIVSLFLIVAFIGCILLAGLMIQTALTAAAIH